MMTSHSILFDQEKLNERAKTHKLAPFKVKQTFFELFKNQNIHWEEMTTLSKDLKQQLQSDFSPLSLKIQETIVTEDTIKFAFSTHDGHLIEAVTMLHRQPPQHRKNSQKKLNRITLCISSQVGCPAGCLFCVTGKLGFTRNLRRDEIISQVLYANRYLKKTFGKKEDGTLRAVRNIVFMGMGEPLLNYDAIKTSLQLLLAQERFSLGRRHITISTAGVIPGIQQLIQDQIDVKLAISLHAPNQTLREKLMPIAHQYPLSALMKTIDQYVTATNNRIFYEYIMIKGITDTPALAEELATLLQGKLAHLNLIPYNSNPALNFLESDPQTIQRFKALLEKKGITVTVRESLGRESKGACGQLGREKINQKTAQE